MNLAAPMVERRTPPFVLPGLILAMGFAWLPLGRWIDEFAGTAHLVAYEIAWWLAVTALVLYVRKVERRPLASVGLRRPFAWNVALGFAAGVAITFVLGVLYLAVLPALHLNDGVAGTDNARLLSATPLWWRLISTVRAGVSEEIMFRGYAMERIEELTGSRAVAVLVSCAVFTLAHVSAWGWSHEIVVAAGGLAFSALYLWRRNLWANMVAHCVVDAVSVLG